MNIPRTLMTILDSVVMTAKVRVADRTTRRVTSIAEVIELDPVSKEIITNEVYRWDPARDVFEYSGRSVLVDRMMKELGLTKEYVSEELERRKMLLEWMNLNKIRRKSEVAPVIRDYYADPEGVGEKIKLRLTV
jgi:flagellar protein FlaI